MRYLILVFAYIVCVHVSCIESNTQTNKTEHIRSTDKSKVQTDQRVGDIYQHYTAVPKSQFQRDENVLIDYIVENGLDCTRAENGLYYTIHQMGDGELLGRGSPVKADYKGYFLDGKIFDSSYQRGKPIRFTVGQMAAGWDQGMTYVNRGSKITLLLPSFLAYGEEGFQDIVPPNTVLVFEIDIKKEAY